MRMPSVLRLTLMATVMSGMALASPVDSVTDLKANFSVSQTTAVPGLKLEPGAYSIRVVDSLSDRLIVRIDAKGGLHSTFIGLPNSKLPKARTGIIAWSNGPEGNLAARGFSFPGGTAVEFVYPKTEAVALAKLNATRIPAIDPASEGRVAREDTKELSKDDMEIVTLWTLSSTKVGSDSAEPSIKADRYRSQEVASVDAKPAPRAAKPVIDRLPHTASYLPIVALIGLLSLFSAFAMKGMRTIFVRSWTKR